MNIHMSYRVALTKEEYKEYVKTGVPPQSFVARKAAFDKNTEELERRGKGNLEGKERAKAVQRIRNQKHTKNWKARQNAEPWVFWGLDGEGLTPKRSRRHLYNMMVAAPIDTAVPARRLAKHSIDTFSALYWLTQGLPGKARYVTFSFGYDLTKILEDVEPILLYKLFRPELRKGTTESGDQFFFPIKWPAGNRAFEGPEGDIWFTLDWLNGKFSVTRYTQSKNESIDPLRRIKKTGPFIIFDIFKFFGKAFVGAIEDWKVPRALDEEKRKEVHAFISKMKAARGSFDEENEDTVATYCKAECRFLAEICTLLVQTHKDAGIPLNMRSMYGAGSSGEAVLKALGLDGTRKEPGYCKKAQIVAEDYPAELQHAIMCGFVGGRFENSILGVVKGPVNSYDISSAYPYQCCFLPDLLTGQWELTRNRNDIETAQAAIVHYKLHRPNRKLVWAPFPYRFPRGEDKGSITYPSHGSEGWVWRDEYIQGEKGWDNVEFIEAWVYRTDSELCPCSGIAKFYRERLRYGKEGVGIALKLGCNSVYGKFAQTVGGGLGKFTNWVWAGMITSGTRAQILEVMNIHNNLENLLMVATDGICTLEKLDMPKPKDTGTWDCINEKGKLANKPLGGWEHKEVPKDMAFIRPGIYFPLNPTDEEVEKMRARGIGRRHLAQNWDKILQVLKRKGPEGECKIGEVAVFHGAKTSIYRVPGTHKDTVLKVAVSHDYGTWTTEPRKIKFDPAPKRGGVDIDGHSLMLRVIKGGDHSAPYAKGVSKISREMETHRDILEEQPDLDYLDDMLDQYDYYEE
jgi:hypothetical protein